MNSYDPLFISTVCNTIEKENKRYIIIISIGVSRAPFENFLLSANSIATRIESGAMFRRHHGASIEGGDNNVYMIRRAKRERLEYPRTEV